MQRVHKSVLLLILVYISFSTTPFAQSKKNTSPAKIKVEISGNFIVAADFERIYTIYGGQAIKFSFSKDVYPCISMYPGLRWINDPIKPTALPIPGTGMQIGYKSLILALPLYYNSYGNKLRGHE